MAKLTTSFAAALLATSVAVTEVSAENTIPDGTKYTSDDQRSTQIYDRVNNLPEDATHIFVPEKEYHDQLGERTWITENQFMRGLAYLEFLGLYEGDIEYSHAAVPSFEALMDKFIENFVTTDAKPEDYQNDLYAKYDMLRVHALENEDFVDQVLQQSEEYQRLEKRTEFVGNINRLDGYLGLMGQDYDVGTNNDGRRIQAIQEFREGRTALDFLEQPNWDKAQPLSNGQTELLNSGLALLGYGTDNQDALAAFYKDQNIEIDPPTHNLEALAAVHQHITKDGKAFDRVEEVLYDFDTVEEKIGYAQAALTFYGEHTEIDDNRWAHTMLNVAQLGRRMGDDLEIIKEEEPRRIFSNASHVFWDSIRWSNYESGVEYSLPSIDDVLDTTNFNTVEAADREAHLGGEDMRWSSLTDEQKEQFESRYIAVPLADFEKFLPPNADELKMTPEGRREINRHLFTVDANGKSHIKDPEFQKHYDDMKGFFKEQIESQPAMQGRSDEAITQEANELARQSMMQVLNFMYNPSRVDYSNDETSTLYIYLPDRAGGHNDLRDQGRLASTEHYRAMVHCINERNYLNYRAHGGDPNTPIPFEEQQSEIQVAELAQTAQNTADTKLGLAEQGAALDKRDNSFTIQPQ